MKKIDVNDLPTNIPQGSVSDLSKEELKLWVRELIQLRKEMKKVN